MITPVAPPLSLIAVPVGGAMVGGGLSSAVHGIEKSIKKERIDWEDY
jgi:hypothetical protein